MNKYKTSMEESGFNIGMSMLEVLAGKFHQDFLLEEKNGASGAVKTFIQETENDQDLTFLKGDIQNLLDFDTENDMRKYFFLLGASYWPPEESIKNVFSRAVEEINEKIS